VTRLGTFYCLHQSAISQIYGQDNLVCVSLILSGSDVFISCSAELAAFMVERGNGVKPKILSNILALVSLNCIDSVILKFVT